MNSINKYLKVSFLMVSIVLAMAFLNYKSSDEGVNKIVTQFTKFHSQYPQQKIYVQTDKNKYLAGETIWLKAYLLDIDMFADTTSKEISIDLVDCSQKVVKTMVLKNSQGSSQGEILLNDSILEGNYLLRAYTNWMRNFSNEFLFSKTIEIKNPNYENLITPSRILEIKEYNENIKKKEKQLFLSFFPEGGSMVCGLPANVAFKSENDLGLGVDVTGSILDDKGIKVADLKSIHLGMGTFQFTPEIGKKYAAQLMIDGKNKKFDLPMASEKGVVFTVDDSEKEIVRLNIQSSKETSPAANEIIILAQARGKILYMSKGNLTKPIKSSLSKKLFPAGIAQFTVFDGTGQPLCERLIFIGPKTDAKMEVTPEINDDEISYHLKLKGTNPASLKGDLSFAVTEKLTNQPSAVWKENIFTKLLLTSDLKGKIENPMYYFNPANADAATKLNLVMLTHGWRRFVWKEIMANNFPNLSFSSLEGKGMATSPEINLNAFYPAIRNDVFDKEKLKYNTKKERIANNKTNITGGSNLYYVTEKDQTFNSIVDYIKVSLPGVTMTPSGIRVRGLNSINSSPDALIILDSQPITFGEISIIRPFEIESVELLKGADATSYGVRGGNGVIILHSRKNNVHVATVTVAPTEKAWAYKLHTAREFYVPHYETWNYKPMDFSVPRTIFWKPTITTDANGVATVKFKNTTDAEKYIVTIEGTNSNGEIIHYTDETGN